ncbi:helix-turn-helix domain-containing protein [Salmonella enterica]|uniref:helix-turn-helix domain-containing protein n=1 Tax=Salmonella enterica TaxID=28901 RepID=UPI003D766AB6
MAAELRVHYRTVLDYIHTGMLHAVKQGKHYFIRRSELERFKGGPAPVPAAV